MKKLLIVVGTRPEAIKMIPLIKVLNETKIFNVTVCCSGQHTDLIDPLWTSFSIEVQYKITLERLDDGLNGLMSNLLIKINSVINEVSPDLVLVHGDTSTAMTAAIAAFHNQVRVAHVEAGLRSHNLTSPFPEEAYRRIIDAIADIHFAPTKLNEKFLIDENIQRDQIVVTGNTVIDILKIIKEQHKGINEIYLLDTEGGEVEVKNGDFNVLFTMHRRENFGKPLTNIITAIKKLTTKYPDIKIIIPVHPNPYVFNYVHDNLINIKNIFLLKPVEYEKFVVLMSMCKAVYTDSGGIQEEAPSLGIPTLVLRENTERLEALASHATTLIGTNVNAILETFSEIYSDNYKNEVLTLGLQNPYGDGTASIKIRDAIIELLQ